MSDLTLGQNTSPFDAIRNFDAQGNEFWLARELMSLLGYPRWNEFNAAIERAKAACQNTGNVVTEHFSGSTQKNNASSNNKNAGRSGADYRLTRYGCYLTAMNGDPRKPEIAAAQSYFAVKTYEAEKAVPQLTAEIERLKLQLEVTRENNRLLDKIQWFEAVSPGLAPVALGMSDRTIETIVEVQHHVKVNEVGKVVDQCKGQSKTSVAKSLGMKKPAELVAWLRSIGREDLLQEGFAVVPFEYVTYENLQEIRRLWAGQKGNRQKLLGEWT